MVSATELELQSLGRDDVLRFNTGDWVEIVDDVRELSQRSGEMRQHHGRRSGAPHHVHAGACRPRCCRRRFPTPSSRRSATCACSRWDQNHEVLRVAADGTTPVFQDLDAGTSGVIDVPAGGDDAAARARRDGAVLGCAAGRDRRAAFRAGDYWVVRRAHRGRVGRGARSQRRRAASTTTTRGSASGTSRPARSATAATAGRRPGGGDDCSCTVCVSPESHADGSLTIQAAIDRIRDSGGTVCLTVGQYALRAPVQLNGVRAITIRGQGAATVLVAPEGACPHRRQRRGDDRGPGGAVARPPLGRSSCAACSG